MLSVAGMLYHTCYPLPRSTRLAVETARCSSALSGVRISDSCRSLFPDGDADVQAIYRDQHQCIPDNRMPGEFVNHSHRASVTLAEA